MFAILIGALLVICFVVACVSSERTKSEVIEMRKTLENINKIEIARYKKEFGLQQDKKESPENQADA